MASKISVEKILTLSSMAQADTHYSSKVDFRGCAGNAALYIVSTAGSITITQQCSYDGTNFFDPVNTSGTASGTVATALTVTTGTYVGFSPVLAPHVRFKVVENNTAATIVTLVLMFRTEV